MTARVGMSTHPLSGPDLLNPHWFNRVRQGQHPAIVSADATVMVEGVALRLRGERLPAGTAVRVWLNAAGFFVCATEAEIERAAEERRAKLAAEDAQARARLDALRDEALAFNAKISLPVQWDVGIKDVLSGLSESSWGDGRSKATVHHIYLLEAFDAGRFKRRKGDFLCTSASRSNGRRWSAAVVERAHDRFNAPYQSKVTCKACLRLAARWMRDGEIG